MQCPVCATIWTDGYVYCAYCGSELVPVTVAGQTTPDKPDKTCLCAECGHTQPFYFHFCDFCGAPLDEAAQAARERETAVSRRSVTDDGTKVYVPQRSRPAANASMLSKAAKAEPIRADDADREQYVAASAPISARSVEDAEPAPDSSPDSSPASDEPRTQEFKQPLCSSADDDAAGYNSEHDSDSENALYDGESGRANDYDGSIADDVDDSDEPDEEEEADAYDDADEPDDTEESDDYDDADEPDDTEEPDDYEDADEDDSEEYDALDDSGDYEADEDGHADSGGVVRGVHLVDYNDMLKQEHRRIGIHNPRDDETRKRASEQPSQEIPGKRNNSQYVALWLLALSALLTSMLTPVFSPGGGLIPESYDCALMQMAGLSAHSRTLGGWGVVFVLSILLPSLALVVFVPFRKRKQCMRFSVLGVVLPVVAFALYLLSGSGSSSSPSESSVQIGFFAALLIFIVCITICPKRRKKQ